MLLMMTSFTRIIIVLSLLRHALGTQTSPPNQVLVGLALFLTFFIMAPVAERIYTRPTCPISENRISFNRRWSAARCRLRAFMLKQVRERRPGHLLPKSQQVPGSGKAEDIPMRVLIPPSSPRS
jgi:flagellar biosynthetic protein FliP